MDTVPNPDANGDGQRDATYSCLSCHGTTFAVVRNCGTCHKRSPHHVEENLFATVPPAADALPECKKCHGSVVDDPGDGHYIPTYEPSIVTPKMADGEGEPLNSRGNGAGACDYCHDADNTDPALAVIQTMESLHHGSIPSSVRTGRCIWCHDSNHKPGEAPFTDGLRTLAAAKCENCHGPTSLHNIQADSTQTVGAIVVGGEDAGYGHVGRDAGPGDSDCWGCHGFSATASAPGSGPVTPTVYVADKAAIAAGTDTVVILMGAALSNTADNVLYEADVALTAADGTSVTLQPDVIVNEGMLAVTIPANTAPGNYSLRALKADMASNPVVVTVVPQVKVTKATWSLDKRVTITGSGFAGYAAGSGTAVTGEVSNGTRTKSVTGEVVSWDSGKIVVKFPLIPSGVTVKSVFGDVKSTVGKR
ncbi:MAG: hypothetical protein ACYC35_10205 [Pirellulales bacterium]